MSYTFRLSYDKRSAGPAVITLRNGSSDAAGEIAVSHECFGIAEFDAEVARLKAELDRILGKARRDFEHQPKELFSDRAE